MIYVSSCSPTTSTLTKITDTSQFSSHGWVPPSAASPTIIHPPRTPQILRTAKSLISQETPRCQKYQILVPCLPILARTPSACSTARALLQRSRPHEQLNTFRIYGLSRVQPQPSQPISEEFTEGKPLSGLASSRLSPDDHCSSPSRRRARFPSK